MSAAFPVLVSLVLSSISALDLSNYKPEHCFKKNDIFTKMDGIILKKSSGELNLVSGSNVFTDNEKQLLLESAKANNMYSVRIPVRNDEYIEASIQSCQIIASRMRVKFTVSVNDVGDPIAIHMSTPKYDCPYDTSISYMNLPDLSITLELQKPKLGSSPETAKYLEKLEKQREEMARAEQSDNRSFFSKYWTYIIPAVFLFILFSSMQDPNAAGGNAGGNQQ
ncbi:hypothetical protein MN116_004962 [Schistosoma mekongi]|uniref:ER membrane protein complex subunit 10 n=1 Tax=Schistosoma mekongi TaxID=38744 RepID=A0AAE1ZDN4_SCHME|nr:hypothetical protein MN116_004962 [Schistosoma mekongi]